jgi:hypothetical protein
MDMHHDAAAAAAAAALAGTACSCAALIRPSLQVSSSAQHSVAHYPPCICTANQYSSSKSAAPAFTGLRQP